MLPAAVSAAVPHRGCFVLNHDTPSVLSRRLTYNTTKDLLALLQDKSGPLYKYFTRPRVRVFFALCFKSIPLDVCGKGRDAKAWLGLTDDLVSAAAAVLDADPALNVEFVLDSGKDCSAPLLLAPTYDADHFCSPVVPCRRLNSGSARVGSGGRLWFWYLVIYITFY